MGGVSQPLLEARARVLHDLAARGLDTAAAVSVVDEVLSARRWWLEQWADGAPYLACLVAQDVQEALLEQVGRWPTCTVSHESDDPHHVEVPDDPTPHELHVTPDLGEDPHWVCERSGVVVAPVGALAPA